ncbi:hypothetical protein E2C01_013837 [Portunus trituberculatus]|uniref:Uncharacterized protein n=1 Tax=Portunus trituberculatus TaxID=210409 RepID=A0A5B7DIH8_PORTR|nr:hypothetical protein [Portunus trituberculatus]
MATPTPASEPLSGSDCSTRNNHKCLEILLNFFFINICNNYSLKEDFFMQTLSSIRKSSRDNQLSSPRHCLPLPNQWALSNTPYKLFSQRITTWN